MPADDVFSLEVEVPVRFSDIDVGGHAHHSHLLVYIEEARWRYWEAVTGRGRPEEVDYILAEVRVRYRARVLYPDALRVGVRVVSVGRRHFEMEYRVRSGEGALLAEASSMQVMYDYEKGETAPVSAELRGALEAFEGRALPARRKT